MLEDILDAIRETVFTDPGFYAAKAKLRKAFPLAETIEIAEGNVMVVHAGAPYTVTL